MIAKRTLEKWRAEALRAYHASADENDFRSAKRILALTQDLLDLELLRKGGTATAYLKSNSTKEDVDNLISNY